MYVHTYMIQAWLVVREPRLEQRSMRPWGAKTKGLRKEPDYWEMKIVRRSSSRHRKVVKLDVDETCMKHGRLGENRSACGEDGVGILLLLLKTEPFAWAQLPRSIMTRRIMKRK